MSISLFILKCSAIQISLFFVLFFSDAVNCLVTCATFQMLHNKFFLRFSQIIEQLLLISKNALENDALENDALFLFCLI